MMALLKTIPEAGLSFRYEPGKWSIKGILGHIIDDERIFVYRALRFARNDTTAVPGFDQELYAAESGTDQRKAADLSVDYSATRLATMAFFGSLSPAAWSRQGTADGNQSTVRALLYHIVGHELHHLNVTYDRYLPDIQGR